MTKYERLNLILKILRTGDHLETPVICERLGTQMEAEFKTPTFKRMIARDLNALVDQGKLDVEYYGRDNCLLEDYDPEIHKNVLCKWYLAADPNKVLGAALLQSLRTELWNPDELCEHIRIHDGDIRPSNGHKYAFFLVANKYLCLEIDVSILPFSILVTRMNGEVTNSEKKFALSQSKNCAVLKFPYPELSSFRGQDKPGHALIKITNEKTIEITDLDSLNGSFAYPSPLEPKEVERIRDSHNMTKTLKKVDSFPSKPEKISGTSSLNLPTLIEVGSDHLLFL